MDWPTAREIKKLLKAGKFVSQRSKKYPTIHWLIIDAITRNGQLLVKDCQHHWYGTEGTTMEVKEN